VISLVGYKHLSPSLTHFSSINYNIVLINLFEPIAVEPYTLDEFNEQVGVAEKIFATAQKHLETLLRAYYLRHGFKFPDVFLIQPLLLLGFMSLHRLDRGAAVQDVETVRSSLFLVAKGLRDQGDIFYITQLGFHLLKSHMRLEEIELLPQTSDIETSKEPSQLLRVDEIQGRYPVGIISILDDPESRRLENSIHRFLEMTLHPNNSTSSDDSMELLF
jgi:hypothetical protein